MTKLNKDLPLGRPALIQLSELTGRRLAHEVTETSGALFRQFYDCLCQNYAPFTCPTNLIPDTSEVGPEVPMRTVLCNKTHRTSCGHTAQNADNV